ncbi:DUF1963 domain-containing protein [Paenibacillus alba]|uniref:DUF1963 domain-containing protein n=1 Tax=Paenibacillus alba TaxID=1197127 RepID=UPI00156745BA|nr:DUF1963 domain-containing protein [Paenibacillus alba]NQX65971.1 DUF1963 domain-containing protein [Paenibacillus alba]
MSERLPCQTPGCSATILPTTALKTGGICMPCHQKKLALEKETYILQNRKDVDRYAGIIDPVEILKIMHTPRKYNLLENDLPYHRSAQELYHQLTEAERKRLESYAITLMDRGDFDQAETILLSLVCFTDSWIEQGLHAFIHKGKYDPGILYKKAGPAIRDELIHRVGRDSANRNHLLLALAWVGDEVVIQLFAKWRQNPPQWASKLGVPPENYAHEAGWELDQDGLKRLLFHPESYHFKVSGEVLGRTETIQSAVVALQTDDQVCHWCGGKLVVLYDCNLQDPLVYFMKLPGQQLRIADCMRCNCYGTMYMKVELDGSYSWSEYNIVPDFLSETDPAEELTSYAIRLSERLRGTYEGSYWTLEATSSQIGGHPAWIQEAAYPSCPCCLETMMFIGQVDMEQAADSEGIYYSFLCGACLISAVNYQQT